MSKVGGNRNFGYGKQMAWAGKQALKDRYGNGHYGTTASHAERWGQFVAWCRDEPDIRDARWIDTVDEAMREGFEEEAGRPPNDEEMEGMRESVKEETTFAKYLETRVEHGWEVGGRSSSGLPIKGVLVYVVLWVVMPQEDWVRTVDEELDPTGSDWDRR